MKTPSSKKIIFIYHLNSSFVRNDLNLLEENYFVKKFLYKARKSLIHNLYDQIKLIFWLLVNIWDSTVIFVWFAGYHSLVPISLAKVFGKKSFIVIGGYDVASIPELNYGFSNTSFRKFFSFNSIKWATCNLAVSEFLKEEVEAKVSNSNVKVLYTGYSEKKFYTNSTKKQNIVLTVGLSNNFQRMKLKGIDFFIKVAFSMPHYKFIAIGINNSVRESLSDLPHNLQLIGEMNVESLLNYYRMAKVYVQFSLREGFPNSVCEAMLCECIPVGLNNGGIPIAIGNCGYIINDYDVNKATAAIEKAMNVGADLGAKGRQHIIDNFLQNRREKELLSLIEQQ